MLPFHDRTAILSRTLPPLLLAASIGLPPTAWAKWFGLSPEPEQAVPDGILTLEFPFRESLGLSPSQLTLKARYEADKPDEKGVRTVTEKRSTGPVFIPVPFGKTTYKYTHAVERELMIKPEWVRQETPSKLVIGLPERLSGPGDYRLAALTIACAAALCRDKEHGQIRTLTFDKGQRLDAVPAALNLGMDRESTLTADYRGPTVQISVSRGSHAIREHGLDFEAEDGSRAVQDAAGRWHISDTAYATPYKEACLPAGYRWPQGRLDPGQSRRFAWAQPFAEFNHGPIHAGYADGPDGKRIPRPLSGFTGCIQLEARGSRHNPGDSETREYHFRNGKLWARDIRRFAFGKLLWEAMEFDGDQQLLFYSRRLYVAATKQETTLSWNRLQHEADPGKVKAAATAWGIDEARKEAQEVLRAVAGGQDAAAP